jgi:maltooligosyltrehalose trehalohydrolase
MSGTKTRESSPVRKEKPGAGGGLASWEPGIPLGATPLYQGSCQFLVWAPRAEKVDLHITAPGEQIVSMEPQGKGYYHATVEGVGPGALYMYCLNGLTERPDPASRFQPQGVHGPSQIVDAVYQWDDAGWQGLALHDYVLYEMHVGAFTPEGTLDAVIPRLEELRQMGVTAVELMPVAQFPGTRNWGYDGVYPYAVQDSYGGPGALQRLVSACHQKGLAVVLDVVYNHLGPEGNYLASFGPYFTDRYATPWGEALNFDGRHSDEVRRYFIENGVRWISEFHIDALRVDAVHAIVDPSARPFLEELGCAVHAEAEKLGRPAFVIPESDRNDPRFVLTREEGGYGLDAVWNDDFHHALHVLLTGERTGYYEDFHGTEELARAYRDGFVYAGQYSAFRMRRHGNSSRSVPAKRFVVFSQNHDQVGNRRMGDRLSQTVDFEGLKLAAGAVILSPFLPLLFMGEEYGEVAPFPYFVSHSDRQLVEAVRKGRREEFAQFTWQGEMPDPQDESTFLRARLNWECRREGHHRILCDFYAELLRLRREIPALARLDKHSLEAVDLPGGKAVFLRRWTKDSEVLAIFHFGATSDDLLVPVLRGRWQKRLDSAETRWNGRGPNGPAVLDVVGNRVLRLSAKSLVLFSKIL